MASFDWIKQRGDLARADDRNPNQAGRPDEVAFRFQKPFAHMEYLMAPEERKVVQAVEARWKERYDALKDYPPMSEGQEHERAVFRAVDGVHRAMDARERGAFEDWKRLEANVDKAVGEVRAAFREQRQFVAREVAEAKQYEKKLAPDYGRRKRSRSPDR